MHYKTIVLEFLHQNPQMFDQLRKHWMLLLTVELFARELKTRHDAWKEQLAQARPGSDPSQIASEALEMALQGLEGLLLCESPPDENAPVSLDAAMAYLRRHTPPA
jgi:hypothetical protein